MKELTIITTTTDFSKNEVLVEVVGNDLELFFEYIVHPNQVNRLIKELVRMLEKFGNTVKIVV